MQSFKRDINWRAQTRHGAEAKKGSFLHSTIYINHYRHVDIDFSILSSGIVLLYYVQYRTRHARTAMVTMLIDSVIPDIHTFIVIEFKQ